MLAYSIMHLGLWYVRNKEKAKALNSLKKAYTMEPDNARFAYVYAVALGETNAKEAVVVLESVYPKHTGDMQVVSGLVYYTKQIGESEKSVEFEKKLKALQHFEVR
jgi:lipopolysaccharide biosynthesis regulator YciM